MPTEKFLPEKIILIAIYLALTTCTACYIRFLKPDTLPSKLLSTPSHCVNARDFGLPASAHPKRGKT